MSVITSTLLKRGMDLYFSPDKKVEFDISTLAACVLGFTIIFFFVTMFTIEYTFGLVIPTLAMVESPQESIDCDRLLTEDTDGFIIKDPEQQRGSSPKYITSSIRGTAKLLGFHGRLRGVWLHIVNAVFVQWIARMLGVIPIIRMLPLGFTAVIGTVLCAQLPLAWTHIVISQPSSKMWFRRLPSMKMWKKIAGPTAIFAVCQQLPDMLNLHLIKRAGIANSPNTIANMTPHEQKSTILKAVGILALSILVSLLVIPAKVILTRVQASLLDNTEETIVPFDRSFGGKVTPEIVGGSGMIGLLEAWKTFDWAARIRLIKTYAKFLVIKIGLMVLFSLVLTAEIFIIGAGNLTKRPTDGQN